MSIIVLSKATVSRWKGNYSNFWRYLKKNSKVNISNFIIGGGFQDIVQGVDYTGQFSIHGVNDVYIANSIIEDSSSDDGINIKNGNVEITSQNHGFEVVKSSLKKNIQITHQSLFDNSIEGIKLKNKPVYSVQYHPESNPGPQDSVYLFKEFINSMKKYAKKKRY